MIVWVLFSLVMRVARSSKGIKMQIESQIQLARQTWPRDQEMEEVFRVIACRSGTPRHSHSHGGLRPAVIRNQTARGRDGMQAVRSRRDEKRSNTHLWPRRGRALWQRPLGVSKLAGGLRWTGGEVRGRRRSAAKATTGVGVPFLFAAP